MKSLLIVALFTLLLSCGTQQTRGPASIEDGVGFYSQQITEHLERFQDLVEENLVWREQVIAQYNLIMDKIHADKPLSNGELEQIHDATNYYTQLREKIIDEIEFALWITDPNVEFHLGTTTVARVLPKPWYLFFTDDSYEITINPSDAEGQLYIKSMKLSLAAAMLLYDNYILAIRPYFQNEKIRRIIDRDNVSLSKTLQAIAKNFSSIENYERASRAIRFTKQITESAQADSETAYFDAIFASSYTYQNAELISAKDVAHENNDRVAKRLSDSISALLKSTTNNVSKVFGNTVGLVQSRKGKLLALSKEERMKITKKLKPLDILLEKTPFRLTDKFIPGHWGHVAVWVGTKEELIEIGVWDELPELYAEAKRLYKYKGPSFQESVMQGHFIVEALRPGVQINSLDHFLNIDDLGVLRVNDLSLEKKKEFLIQAFIQIGKAYDFNFDVETDKKIVCSELAYVVFNEGFNWPTSKTAGRHTISPDNVAELAVKDGPLTPVLIYHDGKELPEKHNFYNFDKLLKLQYKDVRFK